MARHASRTSFTSLVVQGRHSFARKTNGFTIVELLIVIVVIAILAAITIVAYNGIQNNAKASALQSTAKQAFTKIQSHALQNAETYPASPMAAGLTAPAGMSYQYYVNNAAAPRKFCVSVSNGSSSYFLTHVQSTPKNGSCNEQNIASTSISDWTAGDYSQASGSPNTASGRIRLNDLLAVEPGATYALNLGTTNFSYVFRSFDTNQNFVASIGGVASGSTITIAPNVSYLGVGIYSGTASPDYAGYTTFFNNGSIVPTIVRQ